MIDPITASLDFTQGLTTFNVGANSTTFSSTGLVANTVYFYRVRAAIGGSNTTSTYWAQAKTLNATQPVLPVVTVTPSPTSVQENGVFVPLRFTRTGGDIPNTSLSLTTSFGAAGDTAVANTDFFPVFWGPGGPNSGSSPFSQIFFQPGQSQVDVTVQILDNTIDNTGPNKFFTVSIQPSEFVYAQGNPAASVVTIVDDEGGGSTAIPVPLELDLEMSNVGSTSAIQLTWNAPDAQGGWTYSIYRSTTDAWDTTTEFLLGTTSTGAFVDNDAPTGTQVFYAVVPTRGGNPAGFDRVRDWNGNDQQPVNLKSAPFNSYTVGIHWNDRSSGETAFRVERQVNGNPTWELVAQVPKNQEMAIDRTAFPGNSYVYRVISVFSSPLVAAPNVSPAVATRSPSDDVGTVVIFAGMTQTGGSDEGTTLLADRLRLLNADTVGGQKRYAVHLFLSEQRASHFVLGVGGALSGQALDIINAWRLARLGFDPNLPTFGDPGLPLKLATVGYSWGGGATWAFANKLATDQLLGTGNNQNQWELRYSGYIDAFTPRTLLAETRFPTFTKLHSNMLAGRGLVNSIAMNPNDGPLEGTQDRYPLTHGDIDDDSAVGFRIESALLNQIFLG
jgi:hypothetical protein